MTKKSFRSPEEACLAVSVDFDATLPDCGQNRRLNVSGDPRGVGDANIYAFSDGNGGCVTNFKSGQRACWYTANKCGAPAQERRNKSGDNHDPLLRMLWREAKPVVSHPYLENKCVKPNKRIRLVTCKQVQRIFDWAPWGLCDPLLCIPLTDGTGLVSMQFIDIRGQKLFLKGHTTTGAYWCTGKRCSKKPLGIAEGVATAISVATVNEFPVVAAMSCGNLLAVAHGIRNRFPDAQIYVLADAGKGENEAQTAAYAIGASIAIPPFTAEMLQSFPEGKPTDFNDYYRILGILK